MAPGDSFLPLGPGRRPHPCAAGLQGKGASPLEAEDGIESAVAHFCFNQAVRFANVLP